MKAAGVLLLVTFLLSRPLIAQELKPFDRLSKNYITLDAELGSSGAQLNGQGTKGLSTTKDYSSSKEVTIRIPVSKSAEGLVVEAYGVYKDFDTKAVRYEKEKVEKISGQEYRFVVTASKTLERVKVQGSYVGTDGRSYPTTVDTGRAVNHGERIAGWFARAILQNEIVGVVGSSPQLQDAAGVSNPKPDGKGN